MENGGASRLTKAVIQTNPKRNGPLSTKEAGRSLSTTKFMKNLFVRYQSPTFILATLATLLTGCGPDYTPIADGMKAIGICLVVYGVVTALGELIKGEQTHVEPPAAKRTRRRETVKREEEKP